MKSVTSKAPRQTRRIGHAVSVTQYQSRRIGHGIIGNSTCAGRSGPTCSVTFPPKTAGGRSSGWSWTNGPQPYGFGARGGDGRDGSDRIVLYWADGAIKNTWVQVTLPALPQTQFNTPDVFYFANLVGETGDPGASFTRVNALDLAAVKRALNTNSVITFRNDFNRDGRVNALDMAAVRGNLGNSLPGITPPPAAMAVLSARSDERPVWDMG